MAKPAKTRNKSWKKWLDDHDPLKLIELSDGALDRTWQPTADDKKAAWSLYTALETRITTQTLHYRSGDEETALESLHSLFQTTRDLMVHHGPACEHFAVFALRLLNEYLRPCTAKWHKRLVNDRLANDDERREFRRELLSLQRKLRRFSDLFGFLAIGENFQPNLPDDEKYFETHTSDDNLGSAIPFKEILFHPAVGNQEQILKEEQKSITARRMQAKLAQVETLDNLVGLSCSGGGIRSATFCLGVVQRIAETGLLRYVDYLSTVSGGGYFGGFLSSYLNVDDGAVGLGAEQLPFSESGMPEPAPIRQLRNNTKYLLKDGVLGQARMIALVVAGIFVNFLSLLPFILFIVLAMEIAQLVQSDVTLWQNWFVVVCWIFLLLAFIVLLLLVGSVFREHSKAQKNAEILGICAVLGAAFIWLIAIVAPQAYAAASSSLKSLFGYNEHWILVSLVCLAIVFLAAGVKLGIDKPFGKFFTILAGAAGPAFLLAAVFWLDGAFQTQVWWHWVAAIGAILVLGTCSFVVEVNQFTPYRYYRNRLAETYLLRKDDKSEAVAVDLQQLSKMRWSEAAQAAPYHLINAALNVPASKNPDLRGRNTDFFLFSQHYCGSPLLGYVPTTELEAAAPGLDLGTAVAISGAAASSYMGTQSISGSSFWLALFNIRLGYWLPNLRWIRPGPANAGPKKWAPKSLVSQLNKHGWRSCVPLSWHFLFELTGSLNEDNKFVNLSDGGHLENLGLYELLRRRCKYIIALDGEADPNMRFDGLIKAIRFAQIDFGINIDIDLSDLKKARDGHSKAHFALGKIYYPNNNIGLLLYIKSSLTGNERNYIQDYRVNSSSFPHETTADQFFDEPQFEAYRALGYHIGGDLFSDEIGTQEEPDMDVASLFNNLAENLIETS